MKLPLVILAVALLGGCVDPAFNPFSRRYQLNDRQPQPAIAHTEVTRNA